MKSQFLIQTLETVHTERPEPTEGCCVQDIVIIISILRRCGAIFVCVISQKL